jgi:hypothetical protein
MSVGCYIVCAEDGTILNRIPVWPWPKPGEYPKKQPDGTTKFFFPEPYFRFPLRGVLREADKKDALAYQREHQQKKEKKDGN